MLGFAFLLKPRLGVVSFVLWFCLCGNAQAENVRISNLSDIRIPSWITGDPDIIQDVLVCVYTEKNDRKYEILAIGDGSGFLLRSGPFSVPYTVTWNDGGAGNPELGSTAFMSNNISLTDRRNARIPKDAPRNSDDCVGGSRPTARARIKVPVVGLESAPDGTFTGALTFILKTR